MPSPNNAALTVHATTISDTAQRAFTFSPISKTDLLNVLQRLQIQKACGLDRLHNRLLKEFANEIGKPLLHIFNLSLSSGRFPKQWKVARIQPVYKQKGDQSVPQHCRPVALLPAVSKVFEVLVKKQLLNKPSLTPSLAFSLAAPQLGSCCPL